MPRDIFFDLTKKYTTDFQLTQRLWIEIEKKYSAPDRHYHTRSHLENLISQLEEVKTQIHDWDSVLFAVFYHDVIYKATSKNNEEKSADLARKRLREINIPQGKSLKCTDMILATKKHLKTGDNDTDLFIDADLSILGQSWDVYATYFHQVRKEYSIYPDFIYNPGRKKVLNGLLQMERIYKSMYFYDKLEAKARQNLAREMESYS
ncbi:MAG TPA: hypothetical protein VJ765_15920 [Chitinophagaceae bacterium]|nr:hypothetical protein [Chitinophagaceae bacterium]